MNSALCCTNCGETVVKSMSDGSTKIRSKVLVFKENKTIAICKGCGTELPVPVQLDEDMAKSIGTTSRLRLYVKK